MKLALLLFAVIVLYATCFFTALLGFGGLISDHFPGGPPKPMVTIFLLFLLSAAAGWSAGLLALHLAIRPQRNRPSITTCWVMVTFGAVLTAGALSLFLNLRNLSPEITKALEWPIPLAFLFAPPTLFFGVGELARGIRIRRDT